MSLVVRTALGSQLASIGDTTFALTVLGASGGRSFIAVALEQTLGNRRGNEAA